MPLIAAGIGGGLSAAGSIFGGMQASKESAKARKQAAEFTNRALAELEKVGIPSIEAQKIVLESPQEVFRYIPQLEQEFPELKSQFDDITNDPRLVMAQAQALEGIRQRAESGLTSSDLAEINALKRGTAQQAAARDATLLQSMEQRGMGDSGQALMLRQGASQAALQTQAEEAEKLAKMITDQKLNALQLLGQLSGQQQSQSFEQQAQKASAADTIAQANRNLAARQQSTNVGAQNEAALRAAEMKQQLENQRVSTANQQQMYNKDLIQQNFQNQMQKAGAASSALTGAANSAIQAGANAAANKQAMWSGAGQAGLGAAQLYGASQKDKKE